MGVCEQIKDVLENKVDTYTKVGSHLMMRRYGPSPHFEITSSLPGVDGNRSIIVHQSDLHEYAQAFSELVRLCAPVEKKSEEKPKDVTASHNRKGA